MLQKTALIECWSAWKSVVCPNVSTAGESGEPAFETCLPYSMQ